MEKVVLRILIFDMKQFVAIYILCLLFLPLHGQKVFGYYRYPSHNGLNSQWKRVPQNDTVLSVTKQKREALYRIYHIISRYQNEIQDRK